jgi:hypothetical protein
MRPMRGPEPGRGDAYGYKAQQGRRAGKVYKLMTAYVGGMWRAWFDGRGRVVGFGQSPKEAKAALIGLM